MQVLEEYLEASKLEDKLIWNGYLMVFTQLGHSVELQ